MTKKLLLLFISTFLINGVFAQYCDKARNYSNENKQIQAFTQDFYMYKCACLEEGLSEKGLEKKVIAAMTHDKNSIKQIGGSTSHLGNIPSTCKIVDRSGNSGGSSGSTQTPTQQKLMKSFANYNKAMGLKNQGIGIAKAFSKQVKNYSQLNKANTPEALLQNFNKNMQAIADLQIQNKSENLNQVTNTLTSTVNDLNSGNHEGALFSALSLLDQGEAKRLARREADAVIQNLIYQNQQQMTAFYWKAVELNNQAIQQYYEKAAYSYSKEEETYLLEYVRNLECHKEFMKNNFNYTSTAWTQNRCTVPDKRAYTSNNLIARDIQYINAAKRKYALYKKNGEPIFQQGAMRFAGLAATENAKIEYYYLMGHFAGTNNPLVAYSSFLTAKSKNSKYFIGDKSIEFEIIKISLELSFKKAIEENDQEVIKKIIGSGLHQSVSIEGYLPIIYAIKVDQSDVVYAFLNTELEGETQSIINTKVQSTLFMSSILDAPNTIQKFVDLGFSIDFSIDGETPLDVAEQALAINSFNKISELLGGQSEYTLLNSDAIKLRDLLISADVNDTIEVMNIFHLLKSPRSKQKALELSFTTKNKAAFFTIYKSNKEFYSRWVNSNRINIFKQFSNELLYKNNSYVYKYLSLNLVQLNNGVNLISEDLNMFIEEWIGESIINYNGSNVDYNFIKFPTLSMMKEAVLGENNFNKASAFKTYIDIPFYQYESQNLARFAIDRCDANLMKTLLDRFKYTKYGKSTTYDNDEPYGYGELLARAAIRGQANYLGSTWGNRELPKQTLANMYYNQYQILDMLIFDYGHNKNTLSYLLSIRFSSRDNAYMQLGNPYIKKLIDKLIKKGKLDLEVGIRKYDINQWKKQTKGWEDEKYWKAILDSCPIEK
tara:strand:- start:66 stop:2723 length:2658 start_codon:yes stop_codon:yes gene_type:complete